MPTEYMDDVVQGKRVIQRLDVEDLPPGEHSFWFQAGTQALGLPQHVPVRVIKGQNAGHRVVITAGVHGDEMNGILSAQALARALHQQPLCGTVVVLPLMNQPGVLSHSRDFTSSDPEIPSANLNRGFPGNPDGDAAQRYLHAIWTHLLQPNADMAIDLHTQTRGTVYPLYVFADCRVESAATLARLMNPDMILDDPGEEGVLETVWNNHGVPCITVEVGMGKVTQPDLIDRAVAGVMNTLRHYGVCEGQVVRTQDTMKAQQVISVRASRGGFVLPQVNLLDRINKDDLLAIQYDAFGDEVHRYLAPDSGVVVSYCNDALREPGALLVRLVK